MALTKISGPISNFREETEITSTTHSAGFGNTASTRVRTEKLINFRVGNTPVSMKLPKGIELANGDEATVVGSSGSGGIKAVVVRNDTTGIAYGMSTIYVMVWAIVTTLVGLATLGMVVGLLILPLGLFLFYKGIQLVRANRMLAD